MDDDAGLAEAVGRWSSEDLLIALDAADVPAELVRQDWEHGFFDQEIDQPSRLAVAYPHPEYGRFEQPGAFWNPGDLGFDDDEIRSLLDSGVVTTPRVAV